MDFLTHNGFSPDGVIFIAPSVVDYSRTGNGVNFVPPSKGRPSGRLTNVSLAFALAGFGQQLRTFSSSNVR